MVEQSDQTECYYNMDEKKRKPETAISVEELPDVVLQPEFREAIDEQFNVSTTTYTHVYHNCYSAVYQCTRICL